MPIPEKIGKYEIVRLLGRGAKGFVYKAKDPTLKQNVALKCGQVQDGAQSY